MFWTEFILVLTCILIGSKLGGIGLGAFSGIGLAILAFLFDTAPTSPPINVLLIVLSVITAVSVMQAAGGLNYMVIVAERALRKRPSSVTFLAPLISYFFTFITGTGHVVYAILPVIAEVSREANVRPERPLTVSVIASQMAITACPISAATVSLLAMLSPFNVTLVDILIICIPSTLISCILASLSMYKYGKELNEDPIYLEECRKGNVRSIAATDKMEKASLKKAKLSIAIFLLGTFSIILLAGVPSLRPTWNVNGENIQMNMSVAIQIIMLSAAALIMILKVKSDEAMSSAVAKAGFVAIICIFGISWLGDTFFSANAETINNSIGSLVTSFPSLFAIALFVLSILLYSQAATVLALIPLGIALKIPAPFLIAMFPAVNGYFFLPTYGTMLAAISLDQTKTTRIGKYVLNHSFMLPGIVATLSSVCIGFFLSSLLYR